MTSKIGVVGVLAAVFVGSFAATANASGGIDFGVGLRITESGAPVRAGTSTFDDGMLLGHCVIEANGTLLNNGDPIDLLATSAPTYVYCGEDKVSGGLGGAAFADDGVALMYPNLVLTLTGGCAYDFGLMQGKFNIGDGSVLSVTGEATGYRDRSSSRSCASTITSPFEYTQVGSHDDSPLVTELT